MYSGPHGGMSIEIRESDVTSFATTVSFWSVGTGVRSRETDIPVPGGRPDSSVTILHTHLLRSIRRGRGPVFRPDPVGGVHFSIRTRPGPLTFF